MFNTRKLTLGILSHYCNIHIIVPIRNARERVAQVNISIKVQMFVEFMNVIVLW